MIYKIGIEETVVGNFKLEASSREEAIKLAIEKYHNSEFVNEPGDLIDKKISASLNNENMGVWEEF